MNRKNLSIVALVFVMVSQTSFANSMFWGKTGHRVVGQVAQEYLTGKAKRAIADLLDGNSLAEVSTFGDDIKADRSFSKFSPWHYVNYPLDKTYAEVDHSDHGDVIQGIAYCEKVLKDKNAPRADKVFYLKFLVHLVGDLHQPMHVSREEDKGGNDIQVQWFGQGSNLHRVWDSNMIDDYGMSYTELASNLEHPDRKEIKLLQEGSVTDWAQESHVLAKELYASANVGEKLGYQYSYKYWPVVEDQLLKGGIRLAKILNDIYS